MTFMVLSIGITTALGLFAIGYGVFIVDTKAPDASESHQSPNVVGS